MAVTSGKGGVGKTSIATNVAIELARDDHRVCLLDANAALGNVTVLLGSEPNGGLDELVRDGRAIEELITKGPHGLHVLAASETLALPSHNGAEADHRMAQAVEWLEGHYDYLVVDAPAGISPATRACIRICDHTLLVLTPEPTSLTDAFTLLRALWRDGHSGELTVVINNLPAGEDGQQLFERFRAAAQEHLGLSLTYLGSVAADTAVSHAALNQRPLLLEAPESPAARAIIAIAEGLRTHCPAGKGGGEFGRRWSLEAAASPRTGQPAREDGEAAEDEPPERSANDQETPAAMSETFEAVVRWLEDESLDESQARRFFGRIEQAFTARFRRRSADIKAALYEAMLHDQMSHAQLAELRDILESHAPAAQPRDTAAAPTADALRQVLPAELARSPDHAVELLGECLDTLIAATDWTPEHSEALYERLAAAHHQRFQQPMDKDDAATLEQVQALRERLVDTRSELESRLTEVCLLLEEHMQLLSEVRQRQDPQDRQEEN